MSIRFNRLNFSKHGAMNFRVFGIACLLVVMANVRADSSDVRFYIKPKTVLYSPDKKYACWTEKLEEGGVRLMVRANIPSAPTHPVWKSIRTIGLQWSKNSQWLAVKDNHLAAESAVLIFDFGQSNHPLIYQSPLSKTDQDVWTVVKWDTAKRQVELKRERRFEKSPHFETVTLGTKSVEPTLYQD